MAKRPQANRLGMYDDVRQVLDAALKSGGGEFTLPTHGAAVHWRQRAYKFRKLYAQTLANDNSLAMSQYDKIVLKALEPDSSTVVIVLRTVPGVFTPNEEPYISDVGPKDELFDVARELADKIARGNV